jgi:hypothetical protein
MSTLSVPKFIYRPQQQCDSSDFDNANTFTTSGSRPTSPFDSSNSNSLLMKSTLAGVFGSQASLSDLAGDTDPYHYTYKAHSPPRSAPRRPRIIDNDKEFLNDINRSLTTPRIVVAAASHGTPTLSQTSPAPEMTAAAATSGPALVKRPSRRQRGQQLVHAWAQLQLFGFGVVYGELANRFFAQTCYPSASAATSPQQQTHMLVWWAWGIVCLIVGTIMPYLDRMRPAWLEQGFFLPSKAFFYSSFAHTNTTSSTRNKNSSSNGLGIKKSIISQCDWNSAIRTFAAFLGLGLGVRKLPVGSLAQVAWLWALVSPVLWFLLDGTWTGLVAGLVAAAAGGAVTSMKTTSPATAEDGNGAVLPIALCLYFCCALCFGNIGRRLMK